MNAMVEYLKLPPHHVESEQAVLGGLLQDNSGFDRIELSETDFYRAEHRAIFHAMQSLFNQGKPADVVTVAEWLGDDLHNAGGLPYLIELVNGATSANLKTYAAIVHERALLRKLAEAGNKIAEMAYAGGDAVKMLDESQKLLSEIETCNTSTDAEPIMDALKRMVEAIDTAFHAGGAGIKTGFVDLDRKIVGLAPADMVVIAGRPSMGKTSLAMQIAEQVSETEPVLIFSLEMPSEQLSMRMAASAGKLDITKMRAGQLQDDEWERLTYALTKLRTRQIYFDDRPALTMQQIRARARQEQRKRGLGLVVIDHISLIRGEGNTREQEVSAISRQIKALAKELNIPVIALSQLNRELEKRHNKRPVMSDLRDSGSIEQDADLILMLYRDEYYNPDTTWKGTAECIIGKQRNGEVGMVPLAFTARHAQFGNFAGHYEAGRKQVAARGFD